MDTGSNPVESAIFQGLAGAGFLKVFRTSFVLSNFLKSASGTYNPLYILRGALYMFQKQSFIYLVAMLYIEEKYE